MIKHACLGLFAIFVATSPIYVFSSGLPQPADLMIALLSLIVATGFVIRPPVHRELYLAGGLFIGYISMVNLFWWSQLANASIGVYALYYAFGFAVFVVVISLLKDLRERLVTVCRAALAIAILIEVGALILLPIAGGRTTGTLNNPNQLGYWALLVSACALVLKRDQRLTLFDFALLCGAGYAVTVSLSKAALVSFGMLVLLAAVCQGLTRPVKAGCLALAFVGAMAVLSDTTLIERFTSTGLTGRVTQRLANIGEQTDDSLGGRGYDRIWRYPEHLVLGAGEGAAWRFMQSGANPRLDQKELHSTFGTILFSYGIVGFCLFMVLLWVVFRRAPLAHMLYSLPLWAYGMTHHGLRETLLWMFLGLVFGLTHYAPRSLQSARRQTSAGQPGALGSAGADARRPVGRGLMATDRPVLRHPSRGRAQAAARRP